MTNYVSHSQLCSGLTVSQISLLHGGMLLVTMGLAMSMREVSDCSSSAALINFASLIRIFNIKPVVNGHGRILTDETNA